MAAMFETVATAFVGALEVYAALGFLFAFNFVVFGVQRLDLQAKGTSFGFRLLILPGVAAFWPMFLSRWMRGVTEPPLEKNPHREGGRA